MNTKNILLTTTLISALAQAATPPTSADILREVEPQKTQKALQDVPSIQSQEFKKPMVDTQGVKLHVKDFSIEGNSVYKSEILLSLLTEYKNKELSISQLQEAASLITKHYRDNGYFVARAYIPAQELAQTDAIVQIIVIEGLYGKLDVKNNSLLKDTIAQGYMDRLKDTRVISIPSLERQLLLLDDIKGAVVANTQILPGIEIGQSDFLITLEDEAKYNAYVIADNYGSKYTGSYRVNALGFVNSLAKRGDTLGLSTLISNTADLKNARLSYEVPVGYDGLGLNFALSKTKYKIGEEFASQDIHGDSLSFNAGITYALIRQRAHSLSTSLNYTYNDISDYDISQDKNKVLNSISFSLDDTLRTSLFNKDGLLYTTLSLTKGNLSLDSADAKANDTVLNSEGDYEKINFEISQTQFLMQNISVVASIKGQKSFGKNLDGTEDFSIGGAYGSRSYGSSEASGDNGYLTSLEFFYQLPPFKSATHTISTFVDHGKVWYDEDATTSLNERELNSVGLGYSINHKSFTLKATYAHGFGEDKTPTSEGDDTNLNRLFIQGIARF